KNFQNGLIVLKQMGASNVKPDSHTFSYIIGNCNSEEDIMKEHIQSKVDLIKQWMERSDVDDIAVEGRRFRKLSTCFVEAICWLIYPRVYTSMMVNIPVLLGPHVPSKRSGLDIVSSQQSLQHKPCRCSASCFGVVVVVVGYYLAFSCSLSDGLDATTLLWIMSGKPPTYFSILSDSSGNILPHSSTNS
ncbi:hypothetical protein Tco_0694373, partial [Tanacetum coccineum]